MKKNWTAADMPDQSGRVAIVTGANAGIGYETARALAQQGAHVILACRSEQRGTDALQRLQANQPAGTVELRLLDLASLDAVRAFAEGIRSDFDRLDLLINNAGVMVPPEGKTAEGFELQFGVNVIGHFALTGLLIDLLTGTPGARIVTLSSLAHRQGQLDFDNLRGEKPYQPMREYMQSKLGNLVFALALQRRLEDAGYDTRSLGAHPGFTATELQRHSGLWNTLVGLWSNTPAVGALPTLYAATAPEAEPGGYYGPRGFYEMRGHPAPAKVMPKARNRDDAARLWQVAEDATGVSLRIDPA